ncbi:hypothetical protein EIN_371090 [Entamoeba invadens IP1]|uniref:Rho-GAP domain-containing protein n=1 Tax=Entamoeba invadens IP1 TaxID=370355 RepID=A0A0A1UGJ2_ENTIV|nr:hypothetical protein EIN_371090 [Entamoeba invadens IP1]ELP92707.1 hypothetical protein EIN_371090 [Entamoeba invadens IP1]|eukprot:XP_004259478.1 hypothetical protein EIN_371090 [Entamoeba invadens IP1]
MKKKSSDMETVDSKRLQLPKLSVFWDKHRAFLSSANSKLQELTDLLKSYSSFLTENIDQAFVPQGNKGVAEPIVSGLQFLVTNLDALQQDILSTVGKTEEMTFDLKQLKKLFEKTKNQETLTTAFYNFTTKSSFEIPLLYVNFFNSFYNFGTTVDVYFSCNDKLNAVKEKSRNEKQNFVITSVAPQRNVSYCGTKLKEILELEGRLPTQLPQVIETMINYLYTKGCGTYGIFRDTTQKMKIEVDDIYHRMGITDFEDLPPEVVANVLKKFLREMKEKIFPYEVTSWMLKEWQKTRGSIQCHDERFKLIQKAIEKLSEENTTVLKSLLKLCCKIDSLSDSNGMSFKNLAVCFSPVLLTFYKDEKNTNNKEIINNDVVWGIEVVTFLLCEYSHLFPTEVDENVMRLSMKLSRKNVVTLTQLMKDEDVVLRAISNNNEKKKLETKEVVTSHGKSLSEGNEMKMEAYEVERKARSDGNEEKSDLDGIDKEEKEEFHSNTDGVLKSDEILQELPPLPPPRKRGKIQNDLLVTQPTEVI